jgi:hypothetical protein
MNECIDSTVGHIPVCLLCCLLVTIRGLVGPFSHIHYFGCVEGIFQAEVKNKLIGWVDSDCGSDPDTRKSMTGYLMSLNDDAISWRSSRQGGVTLSSSEAEFVTTSQDGQEVVYLRELLKGFGHPQKRSTEIWEDNTSCIMMSENLTNRDR